MDMISFIAIIMSVIFAGGVLYGLSFFVSAWLRYLREWSIIKLITVISIPSVTIFIISLILLSFTRSPLILFCSLIIGVIIWILLAMILSRILSGYRKCQNCGELSFNWLSGVPRSDCIICKSLSGNLNRDMV